MKSQRIITITFLKVLFAATLLIIVACNSKQGSTNKEKEQVKVSQAAPKPPSMDIHTAAFMGNLKAINQHINAGTNLNQKDQYGSTPLIIAATFGKTEVAKALIYGGADLNFKNNEGSTALHVAAFFCRTEIAKALIGKNADKSILNNYGSTALASIKGPFSAVKPVYDQISKDLGPLGLKLDYEHLKTTRPVIAAMLR